MKKTLMRFLAPVLALWLIPSCTTKAADFDLVAREMSRILQNGHYARLDFDDSLSKRIFNDYIGDLDPSRLYFEQGDIDELGEKYETELDNKLLEKKSMAAATEIYEVYKKRVVERAAVVEKLLDEHEFVFNTGEFIARDREDAA